MKSTHAIEPIFLGAYSGIRSMAGPALTLRGLDRHGPRHHPWLVRAFSALAANELLVDKLPFVPPRTHPLSLAARAVSGAFVASVAAREPGSRPLRGLLGAASAVASAFAFTRLRQRALRRSRVLGYALALGEDALAVLAQRRILP